MRFLLELRRSVLTCCCMGMLGGTQYARCQRDLNLSVAAPIATASPTSHTAPLASGSGTVTVVDIIPASLSGETNQDSEPFLAVHPSNPLVMVASAFTPNPFSNSGNAPIYVSQDGGHTWTLNAITPIPNETCDITHALSDSHGNPRGDLYAGALWCISETQTQMDEAEDSDVASSSVMSVQSNRNSVDQPFVRALVVANTDRIYVGVNDFNQPAGRTATVDVSLNGGVQFTSYPVEFRSTAIQDGPSVRPAVARDGVAYAAFLGWRSYDSGAASADVVVVRDDNGASAPGAFQALKDPSDGIAGRIVATHRTLPFDPGSPGLGQERIGSTLSLAVDPNNSGTVYVGWADRVGTNDYTLHVRRSTDSGNTWSASDLPNTTVTNATNIALAVSDTGVVGMLFQEYTGSRWITCLRQSVDGFVTVHDTVLATVPAATPPRQFLPYLGDYDYLIAVGGEFRGIFAANNTPDPADFPSGVTFQRAADFNSKTLSNGDGGTVGISIDPFYFSVPAVQTQD